MKTAGIMKHYCATTGNLRTVLTGRRLYGDGINRNGWYGTESRLFDRLYSNPANPLRRIATTVTLKLPEGL